MILDGVLMLLLVAALGYGVRLERKLTALRAGQLAFASAVNDLNQAAGRAEAAMASLRASGQETDLLHDRIVKAREVKAQLEALIARAPPVPALRAAEPVREAPRPAPAPATPVAAAEDDERALRMAALAERIQGLSTPARAPEGRDNVRAILGALTANQSAKQSLNQARRRLDDDLFAA
ncbi:MAG: DUF6468 domain-containing protein [Brevundimonas sp.]|uniref:DUF6468 domain-containing protein n=1 Tax=Brevundimonas sp. TaxID=1871086 RepID=UPI00403419A5